MRIVAVPLNRAYRALLLSRANAIAEQNAETRDSAFGCWPCANTGRVPQRSRMAF
jgi:hypothetical protein